MIVLCIVILASRAISATPFRIQAIAILDLAMLVCKMCQWIVEVLIVGVGLLHDCFEAIFSSLHSFDNSILRLCFHPPISIDVPTAEEPSLVAQEDPFAMEVKAAKPIPSEASTVSPRKIYRPERPSNFGRARRDGPQQINSDQMLEMFTKRQKIEEAIAWIEKCDRVLSSTQHLFSEEQLWGLRAMRAEQADTLAKFIIEEGPNDVYRNTKYFAKSRTAPLNGPPLLSAVLSPRAAGSRQSQLPSRGAFQPRLGSPDSRVIAQIEDKERSLG
ncbi:hypothetical protein BS17DRAFT_773169 [Gyrodon lividus]|nr:hypothetical protein BS17DRAFT_773169 [Gyrodon lividus]